jgi:hypothetical protein
MVGQFKVCVRDARYIVVFIIYIVGRLLRGAARLYLLVRMALNENMPFSCHASW